MRSNRRHSPDELFQFIELHNGGVSYQELCDSYGLLCDRVTFQRYYNRYLQHGLNAIQAHSHNNSYTADFKKKVVEEYLNHSISVSALSLKHNIPSDRTVRNWIFKYTKGERLMDYVPKPEVYTMKSQSKTKTFEEKLAIVQDFLATGMSYKETAIKHQVSYDNVRSWVMKYKAKGPDGLIDGRRTRKASKSQTDEERLRTEIAALKARNEFLETENAALKKLDEVEREMMSRE